MGIIQSAPPPKKKEATDLSLSPHLIFSVRQRLIDPIVSVLT